MPCAPWPPLVEIDAGGVTTSATSVPASAALPAAVAEAYRLLVQAGRASRRPEGSPQPTAFGFGALRDPVRFVIDACMEQGLLPRRLDVDEVFAPARKILGTLAD